jgi:hypothetical protein
LLGAMMMMVPVLLGSMGGVPSPSDPPTVAGLVRGESVLVVVVGGGGSVLVVGGMVWVTGGGVGVGDGCGGVDDDVITMGGHELESAKSLTHTRCNRGRGILVAYRNQHLRQEQHL